MVSCTLYSIQRYVIKFVSDFAAGRWFSLGAPVSSTNKTDRHDITEILLKVALNTITLTIAHISKKRFIIALTDFTIYIQGVLLESSHIIRFWL